MGALPNYPIFRCVSTSRSHKITDSLTDSQTLSSTWDNLTIPLLFEDVCWPMFEYVLTPCLQTCLHYVFRHVYTMFTLCLQTCLHHIWIHFQTKLEDISTLYLKTCLHHVWRHIFSKFENMFTQFLGA